MAEPEKITLVIEIPDRPVRQTVVIESADEAAVRDEVRERGGQAIRVGPRAAAAAGGGAGDVPLGP